MSAIVLTATALLVLLQVLMPKRWAFVPLLAAALHTSYAYQVFPSFTVARVIIVVGLIRIILSGELSWDRKNPIDALMLLWVLIALASGFGHEPTRIDPSPVVARFRMSLDVFGTFLYAKTYIPDLEAVKRLAKSTSILLIPLAIGMLHTKIVGGYNIYSLVGGNTFAYIRNGTVRAMGPFGTPILAGTMGALLIPFFVIIRKEYRLHARIGFIACAVLMFSTGSTTPIGSAFIFAFAMYLWKRRHSIKTIAWSTIIILFILHFIKNRPIWYLISLTDFTGSSTGWHRARIIDQAINYFGDWWLYGTNYTKHWMVYSLNERHVDLTNYYIHLGVIGGFGLTFILLALFWKSFKILNETLHNIRYNTNDIEHEFSIWCLWALLLTHAVTCLTISYFDQSYILFYFLLAAISNIKQNASKAAQVDHASTPNRDRTISNTFQSNL